MKRIFLVGLVLAILLFVDDGRAQNSARVTPRDYKELESKFRELDRAAEKLSVEVEKRGRPRDDASLANMNLRVERSATSETLLEVDLSTIPAPSEEELTGMIADVFTSGAKCGTIPSVVIAQLGTGRDYEVQADYTYDAGACRITVPKGFVYDRASIPAIVWPIISPDSLGNVAPLLHDYLYRHGGRLPRSQVRPYRTFSREETDDLFMELMTKCGVTGWRRMAAYQAVRTVSGFAWKG
jgi:Protein of unknown function (DUF1353)